ncbi:hypothetical protein I6F35_18560 [Bradyrhizobium sp. BRP22]|uniref:hypothetical protein n=1 Tax=Bradyrhizobium sp. BRP22 TaxID=2793821 RepID=UPI001CD612BC|nr:hypothetical protein [Bradyrhizobium sp. BRP22]MCA1455196.1 hypothetical protein [Bradyrhizobium sp. BRP22]
MPAITTGRTQNAGRSRITQRLISEWIYQDNIPEEVVGEAVTEVEEFSEFPFHTSPLETNDDQED